MDWQTNYLTFKNKCALDSIEANEKRQAAFENFTAAGLPTKKEEAWKFTSLTDFKNMAWQIADESESDLTHDQMQEISKNLPSDFLNFVFVNGVLNRTLSDDSETLFQILDAESGDFITAPDNVEGKLLNLAKAFLAKKIRITLAKHKVIEVPVQIVFVQSSKNSVYTSEKLEVIMEENSEMKLLVHSMSFVNASADAINIEVDCQLGPSARLNFVQLQNEDQDSFHFSQARVSLERQSQFKSLTLSLGNKLTRNYLDIQFKDKAAEATVLGLGVIDGQQHLDNYTFIQHQTGENNSNQHYKSILAGQSRSVFRGRVRIAPNAQKANSEQLNNNLLLTRHCEADSIPQLEIFADDVKAGHGSTVGQLNPDEIFYFLSRGISQLEAVRMLSQGFAKELIYRIDDELIQNYLLTALNRKLVRMVQNG